MKGYPVASGFFAVLLNLLATWNTCLAADGTKECVPGFWVLVPGTCGICCAWDPPGDVTGTCDDIDCHTSNPFSKWIVGFCDQGQDPCHTIRPACPKNTFVAGCGLNPMYPCGCGYKVTGVHQTTCPDCT